MNLIEQDIDPRIPLVWKALSVIKAIDYNAQCLEYSDEHPDQFQVNDIESKLFKGKITEEEFEIYSELDDLLFGLTTDHAFNLFFFVDQIIWMEEFETDGMLREFQEAVKELYIKLMHLKEKL